MNIPLPDNRRVMTCGIVRRFAACLALLSVMGWLELPSEHIHTSSDHGHAVEEVHRHLAVHLADHLSVQLAAHAAHDSETPDRHETEVDHPDAAIYLNGLAAELSRPALPDAPAVTVRRYAAPGPLIVVRRWVTAPLTVHVHAPPWGRLYARRGPPALAV